MERVFCEFLSIYFVRKQIYIRNIGVIRVDCNVT